jgi:hypothetical protein
MPLSAADAPRRLVQLREAVRHGNLSNVGDRSRRRSSGPSEIPRLSFRTDTIAPSVSWRHCARCIHRPQTQRRWLVINAWWKTLQLQQRDRPDDECR